MPTAFCTLFDSRYFSRGIAMCESLVRHYPEARIYVYAFDEHCEKACHAWRMSQVTVVPLTELEDEALHAVRPMRGWAEFCWTSTPCIIRHTLRRFGEPACIYVDADIYFYASPRPLFEEWGEDAVVMITEHRFSPAHDQTATSGIYNVQFMPFRATPEGTKVLEWWREACLESCELDPAAGKCGDQKYLDDWPARFSQVHVMRHLGGGVAPWNVQQYRFHAAPGGSVQGTMAASGEKFDLIFYHFHAFKLTEQHNVQLTSLGYPLTPDVVELIYRPYVRHVLGVGSRLRALGMTVDPHGCLPESRPTLRGRLALWKRRARTLWAGKGLPSGNANRVYHASEL